MLPPELIRNILSGRCFALVGSGPSCEMGYPSWARLAELIHGELEAAGKITDPATYADFASRRRYPELFRQAEIDSGGRDRLIALVRKHLVPTPLAQAHIYHYLTRWPFACYLTTNYDDELFVHLKRNKHYFKVLQNRREDFQVMRDGVTNVVLKLHADLDHPADIVLTSRDYDRISVGTDYFRVKLRALMEMFDILIVGHSLSDFDLDLVLKEAKRTAAAHNPIYMIAPGTTKAMEREFVEKYNIVLIPYGNPDGAHAQLRRLLASVDRVMPSREELIPIRPLNANDEAQITAATSLLIFRRTQAIRNVSGLATEYLGPLVLETLKRSSRLPIEKIVAADPVRLVVKNDHQTATALQSTLQDLRTQGLISGSVEYSLTKTGEARVAEVHGAKSLEHDQAYGQFISTFERGYPTGTQDDQLSAKCAVESTVVESFRSRGLALANAVFGGASIASDELVDISGKIYRASAGLPALDARAAFIDAAREFLFSPTGPQKQYLASVSQGFFLYHMVGLDPTCVRVRQDLFARTIWFCDSSVILPLLAVGSHNHEYARDWFSRLLSAGGRVFVTRRMLREAWEHLDWAVRFIEKNPAITPSFLAAALVLPGYKQNLFLDGFVRLSADGRVSTFEEYLGLISAEKLTSANFAARLSRSAVNVVDMASLEGYQVEDLGDLIPVEEMILADRLAHGIFRSNAQVEAEAEVLHIIHSLRNERYCLSRPFERVYFVSQSGVLNRVSHRDDVITWSPEAVYRYLSALPGQVPDADLLQECMLNEYYFAGASFVDGPRYLKFFGSAINTSKLVYNEQKEAYLRDTEATSSTGLDDRFEKLPDLQKPLFVSRMEFRNASAAQQVAKAANQRADALAEQVRRLESEKKKGWRSIDRKRKLQAEAEARTRLDPKRRKQQERKHKKNTGKKRKQ